MRITLLIIVCFETSERLSYPHTDGDGLLPWSLFDELILPVLPFVRRQIERVVQRLPNRRPPMAVMRQHHGEQVPRLGGQLILHNGRLKPVR